MRVAVVVDKLDENTRQALVSIGLSYKLRGKMSTDKKDLCFLMNMSYPTHTIKSKVGGANTIIFDPDFVSFTKEQFLVDDEIENYIDKHVHSKQMYILDTDKEYIDGNQVFVL